MFHMFQIVSRFPKARFRTSAHTRRGGKDSSLEGERGEAATSNQLFAAEPSMPGSHLSRRLWAGVKHLQMAYGNTNGCSWFGRKILSDFP